LTKLALEKPTKRRVLAIGLDGFEISLARRLMGEGLMPHLACVRDRAARFQLDHGSAKYTGLAWEHVSSGRTPEAMNRYSAVTFDPRSYHVRQAPTEAVPIFARFASRCVMFDVPYCDLHRGPNLHGIARWGAHDPGTPRASRPASLLDEMTDRFGPYPASEQIYAMVWQSEAQTRAAGDALAHAVRVRAAAAEWMLSQRLPHWDLALVVVSEPHSAIEPLWHGVDPSHPLHAAQSAGAARDGLEAVYRETDELIGRLGAAFPDAALVVFAMHGMGPNGADVAAMCLLPELLYRRQFGRSWLRDLPWRSALPDSTPLLGEDQTWHFVMEDRIPPLWSDAVKQELDARESREEAVIENEEIDWQPASRYRPFWPDMEAFAVPSFYDGRVRLNLIGRERYGIVSPNRRHDLLLEIQDMMLSCRDTITGQAVIAGFHVNDKPIEEIGPTESDLYIYWNGLPLGLEHPEHGLIGPLPFRRTGGHSGPDGFLYCVNTGLAPGDHGRRSSFDVVPSLAAMLGEQLPPEAVSGKSFVPLGRALAPAS
jgi:predicted AlkP superfamily phosphohydrolase/phosphomutase